VIVRCSYECASAAKTCASFAVHHQVIPLKMLGSLTINAVGGVWKFAWLRFVKQLCISLSDSRIYVGSCCMSSSYTSDQIAYILCFSTKRLIPLCAHSVLWILPSLTNTQGYLRTPRNLTLGRSLARAEKDYKCASDSLTLSDLMTEWLTAPLGSIYSPNSCYAHRQVRLRQG